MADSDKKQKMNKESPQSQGVGDLSLDDLLARLRDEHGVEFGEDKKSVKRKEDSEELDDFEFDDRPIEADYLNYNIIGRNVTEEKKAPEKQVLEEQDIDFLEVSEAETTEDGDEEPEEVVSKELPVAEEETLPWEETPAEEVAPQEKEQDPLSQEETLPWEETTLELNDAERERVEDTAVEEVEEVEEDEEDEEDEEVKEVKETEDEFLYRSVRERYLLQRGLLSEDGLREEKCESEVLPKEPIYNKEEKKKEEPEKSSEENAFAEDSLTDLLDDVWESECADESNSAVEEKMPSEKEENSEDDILIDKEEKKEEFLCSEEVVEAAVTEEAEPEEAKSEEVVPEEVEPEEVVPEEAEPEEVVPEEAETEEVVPEEAETEEVVLEEAEPEEVVPEEAEPEEVVPEEAETEEVVPEEAEPEEVVSEESETPVPLDEEGIPDYDLTEAFGMQSRDSLIQPKKRGKGSSTPIDDENKETTYAKKTVLPSRKDDGEFTAYAQSDYIKKAYQAKLHKETKCVIGLLVLTLVAFVSENLHLVGITFLQPSVNPILAVAVSSVLILSACLFTVGEYTDGAVMLFRGKPVPESLMLLAVMSPLVYYIVSIAQGVAPASLFGFAFCVCALLCKLQTLLRTLREAKTFSVVSKPKPKRILSKLTKEQAGREAGAFGSYVSPDAQYFCVKRTLFVDDYFKMTNGVARNKLIIALFLLLSMGCAGLIYVLAAKKGLYSPSVSFAYAIISFFYTMPMSSFLLFELPQLFAAFSAAEDKAAIMGESAIENYAGEGVVSFSDSDIFPPSDIALVNILLFREEQVEKMMNYTALVFDEINSSVSTVLMRSIPHYKLDDEIRIAGVYDNGIEAYINGEQVLLGGYGFMESFGVSFPKSYSHEEATIAKMYVAVSSVALGRLDLDYALDPDTLESIKHLAEGGLYIAIRTLDPNLTPDFLSQKMEYRKYPIKLLKVGDDRELLRMRKHVASPIVSYGKTSSLMKALVLCEKSSFAQKAGMIFAVVSMLFGTGLMVLSVLLDSSVFISGIGIVSFQLFWLLPLLLTCLFTVKNKRKKKSKDKGKKSSNPDGKSK